ncbi:oxidoreductase molybdopterin binding [Anaeromyxobacter dehalogenans 2CP-1]|uniref:Oxidoreductase molybdopterin binding n=1 Tax=Anaeromyxobacter dehalogenans (strain ATCC BAA-258 / DSM 21875 / 2CP-1) TaxID=455488 RepID=B8JAT7_ANAD2|nr:sulfite oxidase-like oxidoreductase [Anaeromyxobacter dehalogenans]ACL63748.1 oxidoreductase molybdopterin binding [Anaeromyxobacter dehalogenans 2CP-1]
MDDQQRRIAEGVALLRARFGEKMKATPSLADASPQGDGPANRHGMPKEPPGQNVFEKHEWPVMDLGTGTPDLAPERWRLVVDGAVETPLELSYAGLLALPQVDEEADFHCVTGWSILDVAFRGVRLETVLALARPTAAATHLMAHSADGYSTNLPLEEALKPDVLLVHAVEGKPVTREHGGPVRIVVPQLYAWKGAKWLTRLELMTQDRRGYWEIRGYSNTAHPWRDDRTW